MDKRDSLRDDALRMLGDLDLMLCNIEHDVKSIDSCWLLCILPFIESLLAVTDRLLTFINIKKQKK